jgi:MFS family permease
LSAVVLPLVVLQATGSVISAGLLALANGIPQFAASAVSGVLADRINRRSLAVFGDVLSAAAVAVLAITAAVSELSIIWFVVFGALSAIGDVPAMTAREAMVPQLSRATGARTESLVAAREGLASLAVILGPAVAGALVMFTTPSRALWVTAGTSALAGVCMAVIPKRVCCPLRSSVASTAKPVTEFRQGLRYLFVENRTLRAVTLVSLPLLVGVSALQGLALPAHFTANGQPGSAGLTLSALAVGTLIGAGVYGAASAKVRPRRLLASGLLAAVVGLWLLCTLANTPVILAAVGLVGIGSGLTSSLFGVLSLRLATSSMQGRVLGNHNALTLGVAPLATVGMSLIIAAGDVAAGIFVVAVTISAVAILALAVPPLQAQELTTAEDNPNAHSSEPPPNGQRMPCRATSAAEHPPAPLLTPERR